MKQKRTILTVFLLTLAGLLLSGCSGALAANSWPGVTVDQNRVYIAYQTNIFAVDANTGNLIWPYPAKKDNAQTFFAAPTIVDGQVIIGGYDHSIRSLNPSNGNENWFFPGSASRIVGSASHIGDLILVPSTDNNLYALSSDGQLRWQFRTTNGNWAAPVSDGEVAYLPSTDHAFYAVDLDNGEQVWKADLGGAAVYSPALGENGTLYVGTLANTVLAFDHVSGRELWKYETSGAVWAQPVLVEDTLYFGDVSGNLYGLDAATGREVWKTSVDGAVVGSAAVIDEALIFVTDTGLIQWISFDGQKGTSRQIDGKLYTTPVVAGDRVIVAAVESSSLLYTYDFQGNEGWKFVVPK